MNMIDIVERLKDESGDAYFKMTPHWLQRNLALRTEAADTIFRLRSRIAELSGALKPLANEARGLEWRASQIIEVIGDTNWNVLQGRVNEAMGLLEPALSCHTAACKDSEQLSKSQEK